MNYDALTIDGLYPHAWANDRCKLAKEIELLPKKIRSAVKKLMAVLFRSQQDSGEFRYCEVSVGFIANRSEFGFETARKAWHWLKNRIGFLSVHISVVRALDLRLRERKPKSKWGQHILMHEYCFSRLTEACEALGIRRQSKERSWRKVRPERLRGRLMCRCPFHDDSEPSMVLNRPKDNGSGSAYCFGCQTSAFWSSADGSFRVSKALNSSVLPKASEKWCNIEPDITSESKDHEPLIITPVRPDQTVLFRISKDGGKKRIIKKGLVDSLRMMDRTSKRERSWAKAVTELSLTGDVEDKYLTVDSMVPRNYRKITTPMGPKYIPNQWKAGLSRYLLVDLDGFDSTPSKDVSGRLGSILDGMAGQSEILKPGCIVIRTSNSGLQILFQLKNPRLSNSGWMKEHRSAIDAIDNASIEAARSCGFAGGYPDKSAHSVGRNMRAPAYRLDKSGILCRSGIIYDSII